MRKSSAGTPLPWSAMCEPTAKTPTLPSLWKAVDEAAAVDELRELLVKTQSIQERAREWLDALQQREERLVQSSRKGFLRSLEEQIGLPPQVSWRVELIERASVMVEWSKLVPTKLPLAVRVTAGRVA